MTDPLLRILLADDNQANCLVGQTILERAGHKVVIAHNGCDAVSLAEETLFDLIIMDVTMPVMDGLEAFHQIRRGSSPNRDTLVFGVMAFSDAENQQRYRAEGFDAVLTKPLQKRDLELAFASLQNNVNGQQEFLRDVSSQIFSPLLNANTVQNIRKNNSEDRLRELEHDFWTSIRIKCLTIQKTLPGAIQGDTQSLSEFRRAVQAIKGASNSIGLERVVQIARKLRNAPPSEIQRMMLGFIESLRASRPMLKRALSRPRQFDSTVQMGGKDQAKAAHHG